MSIKLARLVVEMKEKLAPVIMQLSVFCSPWPGEEATGGNKEADQMLLSSPPPLLLLLLLLAAD